GSLIDESTAPRVEVHFVEANHVGSPLFNHRLRDAVQAARDGGQVAIVGGSKAAAHVEYRYTQRRSRRGVGSQWRFRLRLRPAFVAGREHFQTRHFVQGATQSGGAQQARARAGGNAEDGAKEQDESEKQYTHSTARA